MLIRSLADANWNPSVVAELHASGCEGFEIISPALNSPIATSAAFAELTLRIEQVFSGPEYWIISGHEIPQPNTSIVGYRKFWKSAGMDLAASSNDLTEWCVSTAEGVKYFGIAKLSWLKNDDLLCLLSNFKTSWIMALNGAQTAQELASHIQLGWESFYSRCPRILLDFAYRHDAILIRSFEANDGRENGVLAIARLTTSQCLLQHKVE
jgi:hypothetical protein